MTPPSEPNWQEEQRVGGLCLYCRFVPCSHDDSSWCDDQCIPPMKKIKKLQEALKSAEAENLEQARLLGIGSEREAKLIAERDEFKKEIESQCLMHSEALEIAVEALEFCRENIPHEFPIDFEIDQKIKQALAKIRHTPTDSEAA